MTLMDEWETFDCPDPQPADTDIALDQAAIDALFGGGDPAPQKKGVRAVIESHLVSHERLPMLEVICERMVRTFATNLRNLTAETIDVTLEQVSSARFGEMMSRVRLPAMFGVFRIAEWDSFGAAVVDTGLIHGIVDALLGGGSTGRGGRIEGRGSRPSRPRWWRA